MSVTIGLTGSIATGKSTISSMFSDYDIPVIDADKISREVVEPGQEAYIKIVDHFGKEILNLDNTLNRAKLGDLIFTTDDKREQLNNIIHPALRKEMLHQRDDLKIKYYNYDVLETQFVFEMGLTTFIDEIIEVNVDDKVRQGRLMAGNKDPQEEA